MSQIRCKTDALASKCCKYQTDEKNTVNIGGNLARFASKIVQIPCKMQGYSLHMLQVEGKQESEKKSPNCPEKNSPNNFPPIQKLSAIQKLAFRNYDSETNSTDSETITIQKLSRFRNYHDSETMTIQKLSRFRNYHDSETMTIQKLSRFRNYHDSETITIQKLSRFRNYHDSETITIQKL